MIEYNVDLASRSYPIYIGKGVIERVGSELSELKPTRILVVTNTTVGPLYAETVTRSIRRALPEVPLAVCTLKDGEIFKTPETLREILQAAAYLHADRSNCGARGRCYRRHGWLCSQHVDARHPIRADSDNTAFSGRQFRRRENRCEFATGQEPYRGVLPTEVCVNRSASA